MNEEVAEQLKEEIRQLKEEIAALKIKLQQMENNRHYGYDVNHHHIDDTWNFSQKSIHY